MLVTKNHASKIVKELNQNTGRYVVKGKACTGNVWPEGDHYYIIDDLHDQKTLHIYCDYADLDKFEHDYMNKWNQPLS